MMRTTLLSLFVFFITLNGWAQSPSQPEIYFDINPVNCMSCIGSLINIKLFEQAHQPYYFVFEEKYKPEKDYIIKKYRMQSGKAHYLWNDSLYNALHVRPGSSVALVSSTGNRRMSTSLVNFDTTVAQFMIKKCKLRDTLHFDHPVLSPLMDKMQLSGGYLYSNKELRKQSIKVLNLSNGETRKVVMTDSLSKLNFLHHFHSLKKWKQAQFIELPDNNIFYSFKVVNDTLFAISRHNYIAYVKGEDTAIAAIYALNIFTKKGFIKSFKISPLELLPDYYMLPYVNYDKGTFYFSINASSSHQGAHHYFMAEYKIQGDSLAFQKYYPEELPEALQSQQGFVYLPYFQKDYFMLSQDKALYQIGKGKIANLSFLNKNGLIIGKDTINIHGANPAFRISKNYLWLICYPKQRKRSVLIKYDRQKEKIGEIRRVPYPFLQPPIIDNFDYNYVYIPIDSKTIVRQHLSTFKKIN